MTFKFEWQNKEESCEATCGEIFHSFSSDSKCESTLLPTYGALSH